MLTTICFVSMTLLYSCNQSQSRVNSLSAEIEKAVRAGESVEKIDLEEIQVKIRQIDDDLGKNRGNYTDGQIREIGRLKARYASLVVKKSMVDFKEPVKDMSN